MPAFRLKCRNPKCGNEYHRYMRIEEFDQLQYSRSGFPCESCSFPKMAVIKSNRLVKDGFKPGFQRNIRKHCNTYAEYKQHIKDMGLIELGNEEIKLDDNDNPPANYWDDELLKSAHDNGFKLSGREIAHLKGEEGSGINVSKD